MKRILVVGGGPAGTYAAIAAKKQDPAAAVTLVTRESWEPYEKPPLSKAVLLGRIEAGTPFIAGPGGVSSHGVQLERSADCRSVERSRHEIILSDGRHLSYDALVLATGSSPRELPQLRVGTPCVNYLRTADDAHALRSALCECRHLVVIGGGLIGLEVAAAAAALGVRVTVLEAAPRILARVCDSRTSGFVHAVHETRGVEIRGSTTVASVSSTCGGVTMLTSAGNRLAADMVVVGIGSKPDDTLAASAGLAIDDGILVDDHCRTSDPDVFAAGDASRVTTPDGSSRLENWNHAIDQGTIAGQNAAGADEPYKSVPSFWSEQYDLYIQGVGWPSADEPRIERPLGDGRLLLFDVRGGRVTHAMGINAQRDVSVARRLIERQVPVDPAALADPSQPIARFVRPASAS